MTTKIVPPVQTITADKAAEIIKGSSGRFLTVDFTKRTNNKLRTMNCRVGVFKGVKTKGEGKKKKKKKNTGLITVFDMKKDQYRNINVSGLRRVRLNGMDYKVSG